VAGIIASAIAGGLAGGGAAGERAFARLGEQEGRMEFEKIRSQTEMDRATALERMRQAGRITELETADRIVAQRGAREREEVTGIIKGATAQMTDEQQPASRIRGAARDALANSGRLREAADYDKATAPDKPTTVTAPYGSVTETIDADGNVVRRIDNSIDRADSDRARATRASGGSAPKAMTQADVDKIHDSAGKFADRLASEMPHPLADPLATDANAKKDLAMLSTVRSFYTNAAKGAVRSGVLLDPSDVEDAIRAAAPVANDRALAAAEQAAATMFDEKGRMRTGAEAAMKEWGIRATDRDGFVRAARDKRLPIEMRAVFEEARGRRAAAERPDAAPGVERGSQADPERWSATEMKAGQGYDDGAERGRPDDPQQLARRTGLVQRAGGAAEGQASEAASARPAPAGVGAPSAQERALYETEKREMAAGQREAHSPEALDIARRLGVEERRRGNEAVRQRTQQSDLERSRQIAREARGQ
jgi:hypothetical protein